jgi:serine/threonine-protein kinase
MLSPGDRVKDYEVITPLRSGGMAMLYLARRRGVGGFSRLVALKLVHSHLLEDESINRLFLDEARISANIAHPNVVNVEEVGQSGGNYFIAMEYVHGVSLAELLESLVERRLRMSPKLCAWLAAHVAEALHAAHEATGENGVPLQIVHRDVSPQNVLISHTGHIKLIDFGIANSQQTSEHDGNGRSVLGKLGYMAPEQLRMQSADRRSDVYALGVTLWEMLTSRNLFRCKRIDDERDWATRESPPAPSKYSAIAMPALDRVVLKAIACNPDDRYDSALAFRAALLRAAPTAAQVDAPMFAALMRTMLGEELERRRANWPSDVNVELHLDNHEGTSPALSLSELTADMGSSEESRVPLEDEDDPTTIAEAPPALRNARPGASHSGEPPASQPSGPAAGCAVATPVVASREARIDTVPVPPSDARPVGSASLATRGKTARALGLAALCLVLGLMLGSLAAGSQPGAALGEALKTAARAAPAVPVARRPTFTVLSELTLHAVADAGNRTRDARASGQAAEPPTREERESAATLPATSTATPTPTPTGSPMQARSTTAPREAAKRELPAAHPAKRAGGNGRKSGVRPGKGSKLGSAGSRKGKNPARTRTVADTQAPW